MYQENGLKELTKEDIDFMLNFIDLLEMGRSEDITAKKQPVS
jgi:hypothetical protein